MGALIGLLLLPFIIMLVGLLGYFIGITITWIPFFADLFTVGLGLSDSAIPTVMAWAFVLSALISNYNRSDTE